MILFNSIERLVIFLAHFPAPIEDMAPLASAQLMERTTAKVNR